MVTFLVFIIATLEKGFGRRRLLDAKGPFGPFCFCFVKSLLGMERQWSREKLVILPTKLRSHV